MSKRVLAVGRIRNGSDDPLPGYVLEFREFSLRVASDEINDWVQTQQAVMLEGYRAAYDPHAITNTALDHLFGEVSRFIENTLDNQDKSTLDSEA